MKKFIALVSVTLCFGFALALANTEESAMNRDSASDTSAATTEIHEQAGTAGISSEANPLTSGSNMQGDTSHAMSKSCIDEKGVTLKEGQKGFRECLHAEKGKHTEQMGGTSETEGETTYKSNEIYKTKPTATPSPK